MIGSFEFSDVVDEAVERSGGQQATATDVLRVRRGLRMLTERWLAQGYNTWRIKKAEIVAQNSIAPIALPTDLDDVIQVTSARVDNSESAMRRISAVEYAQLASKGTKGRPSQFYLNRTDRPTISLFPVGSDLNQDVITIYYVARPADFERYGDTTDDVPGRWLEALISGLSLDLARKRPLPQGGYDEALIQRLKAEAAEAEDLAQRADRGRERYRYRNSYGR